MGGAVRTGGQDHRTRDGARGPEAFQLVRDSRYHGRRVDTAYHFTDDAKLSILQARHEALHRGAMAVGPQDLALGVLHTQDRRVLQLLLPDPASFPTLCRALGGSVEPAPVIAEDVSYEASAREALDGATRIAAAMASGPDTHPVHILLGILRPWSVDGSGPVEAGATALTLAATGLGETRLLALLPQVLALGTAHQA